MPHLVQLDHDSAAFRLGLLGVDFGEALDPSLHRGRRHAEQLGGAVHRQPAQVQQHRLHLDPERHPARRGVGEVQPARLAAVALLAAHEPVLDVPLAPAPLAPQPHPPTPSAIPPPTDVGNLCRVGTLFSNTYARRRARSTLKFEKDYEDICREWLGGLKPEKYKSRIEKQLGRYLDGVRSTGLIARYEIALRASGKGYKIVFYPGDGFYEDYTEFYLRAPRRGAEAANRPA